MDTDSAPDAGAAALSTETAPAVAEATSNGEAATAEAAVPVDPQLQAVNDQLQAARENPSNFSQWVSLVTASEKLVSGPSLAFARP